MPVLTQTFPPAPGGMNTALSGQEIDDTEAQYLQDVLVDKPGLNRRRGPVQEDVGWVTLPRQASGLAIAIDPAGTDRYAALTGNASNGYLTAWATDKLSTVDLSWPHALPTDPVGALATAFRYHQASPALAGGTWIGTASDFGTDGLQALGLWYGGSKADYTTGTITLTRGSATVTGSGTTFSGNVEPGMFLFSNTDDASAGTFTSTFIGVVLSVDSNTQLTLEAGSPYSAAAESYTLTSVRGFIPKVAKGRITCATDSTQVSGGLTKFSSQGLGSGTWNLYRASDGTWIGKVSSVASNISLTLAANAAIALADESFYALRGDWVAADKSVEIIGSTNKTGWLTALYAERQWYANNSAQFAKTYRLWFSDTSDKEAVDLSQDGDWIPVSSTTDTPEPVRALIPTYNALLVLKESETFAVYGNSPSSFSAKKLEDDGTLSTMSCQSYGGGAIWAGRNGIYYYDGVQVQNLAQEKLGDVWKTSISTMDATRYRMWSMVARNHYILYIEDLDPSISVKKGTTVATPDHWIVVINMNSKAFTMWTNVKLRGAVVLPSSAGRGTYYVVNNDRDTPTGAAAVASASGGTLATDVYYYAVTALDSIGETVESAEVNASVTGPTGSVTITWTAVTGADSYRIYKGTVSGTYTEYFTSTSATYTDTGAAGTAGTPPATSTAAVGVLCDSDDLFDAEGVDDFGCDGGAKGPDWYFNSKKYNAGNDVLLKRFKQIAVHYLAQGGDIQVDVVLGLNDTGQTLSSTFPSSVMTWDDLRVLLPNWSSVSGEYGAWSDLVDGVLVPKRVRFLKKDHHMSFRLWQSVGTMTRVKIGPFHIAYKQMRPQRVT